MMKRAFTLIEVNLAILVMAGGILSVITLYSLGFRESAQSREDLASAAYADAVLSPLVAALSSETLTWKEFNSVKTTPAKGWGSFVNENSGKITVNQSVSSVYGEVMGKVASGGVSQGFDSSWDCGLKYAGLVVMHDEDSGLVKLGFRASKRENTLLAAPLYYTEVRFQGVQE